MKTNNSKVYFILFFLFLFLLSSDVTSQSGWFQLTSPSSSFHLYGIYFKDASTGISSRYRTTDGGQSWSNFLYSGYAMTFPDPNTGYIVGGIYKTTNCGLNWIQQTQPSGLYWAVSFADVNNGYACGSSAAIIRTTNGGNNWVVVPSPVSSSYYLKGVSFTNSNNCYICGYVTSDFSSAILKTTNGGSNWTVQNFASGTGYYSIFFVNSSTGVVIGEGAAKTTNAGITWVQKQQNVTTFQNSLYFSSSNTGYSVGMGGNIIKTTDCGETWFQQNVPPSGDLESVYFLSDYTGFVCGDNGIVLKTTDGGGPPIGINPISSEVPAEYKLYQNYPNPFNPSTRIKFDVVNSKNKTSNVKINIYDITGRIVSELVNFDFIPGTYEVQWNASSFPSGVYLCTLTSENFKETHKMILLK